MKFYWTKNTQKIAELETHNQQLTGELQEMAGDILTAKGVGLAGSSSNYRGNEYNTYIEAVGEINVKYKGEADWGIWAGNLIDVRAAFTIGKGLKIVKLQEDADLEMRWAAEFFRINDLKTYLPILFAVESEIEAKVLLKLFFDNTIDTEFKLNDQATENEMGMVKVRSMPWQTYKYTITTSDDDYLDYVSATGKDAKNDKTFTLQKPEFVYRKFGGRISEPNQATPKLWRSLTQIDEVSKAYKDLRTINRILASPTPYFKADTLEKLQDIREFIRRSNWRIGKVMSGSADFSFVGPDSAYKDNIIAEIISKLKSISGNTGVPVHFMGLPDLMSNRSVAENLMELIWASTTKERTTWESCYTEVLRKSMVMRNANTDKTHLDPMKLEVIIPEISSKEWLNIEKVWLPLFVQDAISLPTLLGKIPDLDLEAEKKAKAEEEDKMVHSLAEENERIARENALLKTNNDNNNKNNNNQEEG